MALNIANLDYNTLATTAPTGAGVDGIATAAQVAAVKTAIRDALDLFTGAGPVRNCTLAEYTQCYSNVLIHVAHQGTSPYASYKASWNQTIGGGGGIDVDLMTIIKAIRRVVSVRLWHRAEADSVYRIAKNQGIVFNWGRENGVPEGFGYIGFDTADYITIALSHEERKAINSAFHYAARFASTSVVTDTGDRWSAGTILIPDTK